MRIVTWNVNSIRARQERVLSWLEASRPDVLCLQELKCEAAKFPLAEVKALGYHAAVHGQKTYNGVAILSKLPIEAEVHGLADGVEDPQARLIGARVGGVFVYSVYAPNGQSVGSEAYAYKLEWFKRLRRVLDARHSPKDPLVVCGDFNVAPESIDVWDPVLWEGQTLFSAPEREALAELMKFGLTDSLRHLRPDEQKFTWWDYRMLGFPKNRGLRIDHLLVSGPVVSRLSEADVDREARKGKQPSDHAPVWIELKDA